jgi:hypothetical protein
VGYRHQQNVRIAIVRRGEIEPGADFDVRLDDFQIEDDQDRTCPGLQVRSHGHRGRKSSHEDGWNHPLIHGGSLLPEPATARTRPQSRTPAFLQRERVRSRGRGGSPHGTSPHGETPPVELTLQFRQKAPVPGTDLSRHLRTTCRISSGPGHRRGVKPLGGAAAAAVKLECSRTAAWWTAGSSRMDFHSRDTLLGRFHFAWYLRSSTRAYVTKNPGVFLLRGLRRERGYLSRSLSRGKFGQMRPAAPVAAR